MQVVLDLEKELWEAAQKTANAQNSTVQKMITDLLRAKIVAPEQKPASGFTFSLPGGQVTSDDVRMTVEEEND